MKWYKRENTFDKLIAYIDKKYFEEPKYIRHRSYNISNWESEYEECEAKKKADHPIVYLISDKILYTLDAWVYDRPGQLKRWFKRYFYKRYDIIKLQKVKRGNYSDVAYRLPDAMFTLFESYIKKEWCSIEWGHNSSSKTAVRKMARIYWFKKNIYDKWDEITDRLDIDKEEQLERMTNKILKLMIDVRQDLWS